MLYIEHLRFSKGGLQIVDHNGRSIGFGTGVKKALRRVWAIIEDLELFIIRLVGFVSVYSLYMVG
jgi:hypothetical protein